jgi:hypothetical protein
MTGRTRNLAVAGLLLANLILDIGLVWYGMHYQPALPAANFVRRLQFPLYVMQVLLVGCWLTLGEAKLYWRLLLAAIAAMSIASSPAWATLVGPKLPPGGSGPTERFVLFSLLFFAILLAAVVILLPVRRVANWRLTFQPTAAEFVARQFRVAELMLWMIPIGGFLAIVRLYLLVGRQLGSDPTQFWMPHVEILALAPLAFTVVVSALATRKHRQAAVLLACLTLLIASAFAAFEYFRLAKLMTQVSPSPLPARWIAAQNSRMFWQPLEYLITYITTMLVGLVNCLALRALGWRLSRPK